MATMTDPPREAFRLSQLIYDTRYRSMTIQVVAFILIMLGLWYLGRNAIQNLSDLGKDFDFGFLGNRAGYDINQRLIEYSNDSTHGRAAIVGILNTLLVAFLGCITATILGVAAGVLRLSNNWIVGRLMTVYVEGFRNIPLLLWIIVIFAIMTEAMPQPRDFRGDNPEASMSLGGSVAVTNRGVYIPNVVFTRSLGGNEMSDAADGVPAAIIPAASFGDWALFLAVLIAGVLGSGAIARWAKAKQEATGVRPPGLFWMRAAAIVVPAAIVLIALGATLDYPELRGFNFSGGIHLRNALIALWFALSLYTGAFIAEIVRAGILSVSKGQTEASSALGMRASWTMNLVVLPQALRVIIPPLISQFLNLTKNSSLALAVGYMDVRSTLGGITINQTGRELEGMLLLGAFYLITSLLISAVMNVYNNSVKLQER
ncbi:amino acid ABC transporter permease [Jannaschia sp. CCS1]|uniref:amino acid ABC transporter permease n=1 Tax=Jannaschia sp. (strain CCS1) TaxID=290400 RepID=UPI000053BFEB|nr:ABC transporter permease subunit [Jannaschia sp. CCS1]ABD53545.1 L-aspartate ABC transporter membrane protein / L-asparagine ABC transporter membrane protein / L-glutamine ABC transporter membrane protein / L-glutamate ABC transporter membrane protein [Jannaschia sp. CCS1]